MQVKVERLPIASGQSKISWFLLPAGERELCFPWSSLRRLPWSSLRRRHLAWLGLAVAAVMLQRAVSHVWSFEGTAVAASTREGAELESPEPRAFYARRAEPKDSVVLQGAGHLGEEEFTRYSAALGENRPLLAATSVDLYDDLPVYFTALRLRLQSAEASSSKPMLVPQIALSLNAGGWDSLRLRRLPSGRDDRRLGELVAGLRSLHRPVFLRIGPGCNAQENGYQAGSYVIAFRQVAAAVRAAGLKEVAIVWEWSPDAELETQAEGARPRDAAARWQAFYPGDEFVDWWGVTLYSEPAISSQTTAAFLAEANRQGFPVMIAEATPKGHEVSEGNLLLESWFRPLFGLIARSRGVKAFSYIDRDWRNYPQWSAWGDSRVEANPEVLRYMNAQLSTPLFTNARTNQELSSAER